MSASEKLKALDVRIPDSEIDDLFAALPHIVAVVEAAEEVKRQGEANLGWSGRECAKIASRALSALEEALS